MITATCRGGPLDGTVVHEVPEGYVRSPMGHMVYPPVLEADRMALVNLARRWIPERDQIVELARTVYDPQSPSGTVEQVGALLDHLAVHFCAVVEGFKVAKVIVQGGHEVPGWSAAHRLAVSWPRWGLPQRERLGLLIFPLVAQDALEIMNNQEPTTTACFVGALLDLCTALRDGRCTVTTEDGRVLVEGAKEPW